MWAPHGALLWLRLSWMTVPWNQCIGGPQLAIVARASLEQQELCTRRHGHHAGCEEAATAPAAAPSSSAWLQAHPTLAAHRLRDIRRRNRCLSPLWMYDVSACIFYPHVCWITNSEASQTNVGFLFCFSCFGGHSGRASKTVGCMEPEYSGSGKQPSRLELFAAKSLQ
jgi:hypothetical protein